MGSAPTQLPLRRDQYEERSFQLRPREIVTAETVVSGIILICTHSVTVLMDTRSIQSFVSHHFAILLDIPLEELGYVLSFAVPLGAPMLSSHVYRNYKIHVNNRELTVNLIPLAIQHLMLFWEWTG